MPSTSSTCSSRTECPSARAEFSSSIPVHQFCNFVFLHRSYSSLVRCIRHCSDHIIRRPVGGHPEPDTASQGGVFREAKAAVRNQSEATGRTDLDAVARLEMPQTGQHIQEFALCIAGCRWHLGVKLSVFMGRNGRQPDAATSQRADHIVDVCGTKSSAQDEVPIAEPTNRPAPAKIETANVFSFCRQDQSLAFVMAKSKTLVHQLYPDRDTSPLPIEFDAEVRMLSCSPDGETLAAMVDGEIHFARTVRRRSRSESSCPCRLNWKVRRH